MKKLLFVLTIFMGVVTTGCSAIDDVIDDFINHSRLTIRESGDDYVKYRDITVSFDGNEYNALGTYQVPNNTIVHISWYYDCSFTKHCDKKGSASRDISVGSYEDMIITLDHGEVEITTR